MSTAAGELERAVLQAPGEGGKRAAVLDARLPAKGARRLARSGGAQHLVARTSIGVGHTGERGGLARARHPEHQAHSFAAGADAPHRLGLLLAERATQTRLRVEHSALYRGVRRVRAISCRRASGDRLGDGGLCSDDRGAGIRPLARAGDAHKWHRFGRDEHRVDGAAQLAPGPPEQHRRQGDDHVSTMEHLAHRQRALGCEGHAHDDLELCLAQRAGKVQTLGGLGHCRQQLLGRVAGLGQLGPPARQQLIDGGVALDVAGPMCGHLTGPIARVARLLHGFVDLDRALGVQLLHDAGNAGDGPMAELPRGPVVGLDGVAELQGFSSRGHASHHRRRVQVVAHHRGVERFEAAGGVGHLHHVGHEDMIMRAGITSPAGGVTGVRVDQPVCRG